MACSLQALARTLQLVARQVLLIGALLFDGAPNARGVAGAAAAVLAISAYSALQLVERGYLRVPAHCCEEDEDHEAAAKEELERVVGPSTDQGHPAGSESESRV